MQKVTPEYLILLHLAQASSGSSCLGPDNAPVRRSCTRGVTQAGGFIETTKHLGQSYLFVLVYIFHSSIRDSKIMGFSPSSSGIPRTVLTRDLEVGRTEENMSRLQTKE